jgi:hypothetical protein
MRGKKYLDGKHTILFNVSNSVYLILQNSLKRINSNQTEYLTLLIENGDQLSLVKQLKEELEHCKATKSIELTDLYEIFKAKKQNASNLPESEIIDYVCEKYKTEKAVFEEFIKNARKPAVDRFLAIKPHYLALLSCEHIKEYAEINEELKKVELDLDIRKELELKSFEIWQKISSNLPEGIFKNKAFLDRALEEM